MPPSRLVLLGAVLVYLGLAIGTVTEVGIVGEVAIGWSQPEPPQVWVELDPPIEAGGNPPSGAGHDLGPLSARQSRPIELLQLGPLTLPWAINGHTGGHADWPSLLIFMLTGSTALVQGLHVLLGALLLVLVHRFMRINASPTAANATAIILATSWSFIFYKKVLGGTEILLQASILLCLWAIWSRRWRGGSHGLLALGVGIGLGLGAKLSFGLSLIALFATTLVMRWDRPALRPPLPAALWKPFLALTLLSAPVWTTMIHHALAIPEEPRLRSHDYAGVQWQRVLGGLGGQDTTARESMDNLLFWLGDPMGFYRKAYGASGGAFTPWHAISWALITAGAILGWRDRHPTPRLALLRFCTVLLILQTSVLFWVARDLHHLAQTTPVLAIVSGLAIEQLASLRTPRRSYARVQLTALLCLPLVVTGVRDLIQTDPVMKTISVPTWTRAGQSQLQELITESKVERLVVSDYESYGLLEILCPDVEIEHAWGLASRAHGDPLSEAILTHAVGGHLLIVRPSAPMIYNWPRQALKDPSRDRKRLHALAQELDIQLEETGTLEDESAVLFRVGP
jgi:hypothetical protein